MAELRRWSNLRQLQPEEPLYRSIHWGQGQGLLECQFCGALVFPDPDADFDRHQEWHADLEDLAALIDGSLDGNDAH